jgi:membrane protease YdiL (CAAX protease family)
MVRGFRAGLVRLGMVVPTWVQAGIGVALGVVLAAVVSFALDPAIQWLWQTMGWPTTDVEVFERLMSQLLTPVGAVIIGVTAGIGEEMMVRGLLQPRLGIVASNLVFTAAHAPQYGTDALFSVFVLGLLLGLIRARTNTTTSAIVHGVYDFVVVMAMVMAPSQG